jgi:hypothetical protein
MVLDIYRDCFSRVYIFSPAINVDSTWIPVKKYIEKSLKIDHKKENIFFDHYDPSDLINIIAIQHKVTDFMKKKTKNIRNYIKYW